jgi:hypothetical protein
VQDRIIGTVAYQIEKHGKHVDVAEPGYAIGAAGGADRLPPDVVSAELG